LIVVDHLTKKYGEKVVLDELCLDVERGETMVIIGGSGSGKTTLARHLVGLERPTQGHIYIDGVDLATLHERELVAMRKRFAMVFQGGALLDSLDLYDNVAFPLREETDLDEHAIRERVFFYLAELGIRDAAHQLPQALSGGMVKRASLARALVTEPEILVYDELTSGRDPISSRVVDGLIDQMRSRFFVTSVVITHDMATAFEVADHVALLAHGRIVAQGTPEELFTSRREEVERFANASAVDPSRLPSRRARPTSAEIRAARDAKRAAVSTLRG
jgi:phospholipid/cholesterol/gamma-HCH transport system ATP-binding protein